MSRAIDYFTLTVIVFLLTFVWSTTLFSGWIYALLFAAALSFAIAACTKYYVSKKCRPYSYERLALELSIKGNEYLIGIIKSTIKNKEIENGSNYILLKDSILVAAFKFSVLNISDLSSIVQLASKHNRQRVYVMARGVDRRAYQALQMSNIKLNVIKIRAIFRFLSRHNALPDLKPQQHKFSFRALIEVMFQRSNTKNYIFSGAILISVAFLTPLKIYYLVFGSLSLLLALLTLTPLGKGDFRYAKVFDQLDAEQSVQISIDELADDSRKEE